MFSFEDYLLIESLSYSEALSILGLDSGEEITPDKVKKAYRSASMKAHPDRGGSDADMQRVNAAYALLKNTSAKGRGAPKQDVYADARVMAKSYLERFDVSTYTSYLTDLFGVDLASQDSYNETRYGASKLVEWASQDRETVIRIIMSFGYSSFSRAKSLGSSQQEGELIPGNMSIGVEILHNRKKMKINKSDYSMTNQADVLTDPSIVFPASKIKKKLDIGNATPQDGATEMKKRDFITTLKNKFTEGDMVKGDTYQIRKNGVIIQGTRTTWARKGVWQFNIWPKELRNNKYFPMMPETDKALEIILNMIAEVTVSKRPELTWARYVEKANDERDEIFPPRKGK